MRRKLVRFLTIGACVLAISVSAFAGNGHVDPAYLQVVSAEDTITVDGVLDETDWERRFDYLVFSPQMSTGDVQFAPTDSVTVKGPYADSSTTSVKFLRHGMDLYISLDSDDQSVGKFGNSWEGDGLFMKIQDASGTAVEYKLYYNLGGDDPEIHLETPGNYPNSAEGMGYEKPGTIVNDTTAADSGYSAEMVIHLDDLGYTEMYADVPVLINIFDPDGYKDDTDPWGDIGAYFKSWWGSEWGPDMRMLRLVDPTHRLALKTTESISLDGQLNEGFWSEAEMVTIGNGSYTSTGGYYSQWGDTSNTYEDQSMADVKFIHNGTDLYIGVSSNDSSVCKWSPSWEADGLFLWMTNKGETAPSSRKEIKAMYFTGTEGDGIDFQISSNVPTGAAEGASFEPAGTVTHTESNGADEGYSLEVIVHTADFGYAEGDTVLLSAVIWDLDYADSDAYTEGISDYAVHWWGTQWADPNFEKYFMYRGVVLSDQTVGVEPDNKTLAGKFALHQNYPNPFNPSTQISFELPRKEEVSLTIYNTLGQKLTTLVNKELTAGSHEYQWNGTLENGNSAPAGIYFYELKSADKVATGKMVLLK